jgi:restriction endonuclease S subunit
MITCSIVQKSQLEGALRLDAEYYQPEYLDLISNLKSQKSKFLGDFLKLLYRYPTFYNLQYYDKGILVLKGEDITSDGFIENQSQDFILIEDAKRFPKTILDEGDLIFSVRGYVGKVGIVDSKYRGSIISANLIRAVPKDISAYFLWVFLNSKYGIKQIDRVKMITAQETIITDDIKKFLVPIVTQSKQLEIENLAKQAIKKVRNAEFLYSQAEDLLLEELGLKDFKVEDDLSYIVNLSEVKSFHRADAEYFQPRYEKLINKIQKSARIYQLKEIATVKRGSLIDPKFYDEIQGIPYIRGKDFSSGRLEKTDLVYINRDFKLQRETRVKTGDIVFASIGSIGTSALVYEEFNNSFISNNTGKISINDKENLLPEYLIVILHSIVGKLQFEKESSQTAQPKISDSQIRDFYIPILPKPIQQKIADLVLESHETRAKAKQLLEQAKNKVEKLIEK